MYVCSKDDLLDCLEDFPEIKEYMCLVAQKRRERLLALDPKSGVKPDERNVIDDEDSKTALFSEHEGEFDEAVSISPNGRERRQSNGQIVKPASTKVKSPKGEVRYLKDRRKSRTEQRRRASELTFGMKK
jgi:hypothetical protein